MNTYIVVRIHANTVTRSVFNVLSIGSGLVAAVLLWIKREATLYKPSSNNQFSSSAIVNRHHLQLTSFPSE